MINNKLLNPSSIVVVGGSEDIQKPGGRVLANILDGNFKGNLYVVNPKEEKVQGVDAYQNVAELPNVDCAIIAVAAKWCVDIVRLLVEEKGCRGFIILSAGFSEEGEEGKHLEQEIVQIINSVDGSLIGPNCIGLLSPTYNGVFTRPIPKLDPQGADFITGSGATAVFILEDAVSKGLKFASVYSVGNSAQMGVEEVLEHLDNTYIEGKSSKTKLLYIEKIDKPEKLLKHASSLIQKGCKIAAIKAGSSEAGSRAASSHTGALASSDSAVEALFQRAGIIRCYGREELITVASIFQFPELKGKNIAIVTHAGGPAVMLTDALSTGGLSIPHIEGEKANILLEKLFPGSSVANPIDFLATGTAQQLGDILDACMNDFTDIDGVAVIFGSPGLTEVYDVYDVLANKIDHAIKPIFPILPSIVNVHDEILSFIAKGKVVFNDEVVFGNALCKVFNSTIQHNEATFEEIDTQRVRDIIDNRGDGYLTPIDVQELLDAARIPRAKEAVAISREDVEILVPQIGFPLVMKVVGPVHKSDVGGVVLNINSTEEALMHFDRLMLIQDTTGVTIAEQLNGREIFIGGKREDKFGSLVAFGLGGIFIEALKDVQIALAPISQEAALEQIKKLKSFKILEGIRGQEPVCLEAFARNISKVSKLLEIAPEIFEMDLNPLLGNSQGVTAVDARIRILR